ncbi:MAG: hypothetical protein ACM3JB_09780, partial [Acidobacteriaceae bacterium]
GMHTIDRNAVHALEQWQRFAVLIDETRVGSQISNCSARFDRPKDISSRHMLMLDGNRRLAVNTS